MSSPEAGPGSSVEERLALAGVRLAMILNDAVKSLQP